MALITEKVKIPSGAVLPMNEKSITFRLTSDFKSLFALRIVGFLI
jgi:hypothetical protein